MADLIAKNIRKEQKAWTQPEWLVYYNSHRQRPEDLYLSEQFFLPSVLTMVSTCLDVGCATGAFSRIMKHFNPAINYTGVDINLDFIKTARNLYPECTFYQGDGVNFVTPSDSYDLVYLSGVLHLNSFYKNITAACYAQARRFLLCDFRLTLKENVTGRMQMNLGGRKADVVELPYIVLNIDGILKDLQALLPSPKSIQARGYRHKPSPDVILPLKDVIMAFFLIEKGPASEKTKLQLDFNARSTGVIS